MLVPGLSIVLQLAGPWHNCLLTGNALGGELIAVAVIAQQLLVLAGEGLVSQRAVTAEAAEAVLVVVAILVVQLPAVVANQLLALITGIGEVSIIAGDAVWAIVHLDVLAPIQGLLAVVAVEALGHGAGLRAAFTCCWETPQLLLPALYQQELPQKYNCCASMKAFSGDSFTPNGCSQSNYSDTACFPEERRGDLALSISERD